MHRARAARPRGFDSLPFLSDVGTLSFRWILPFWYFCLRKCDKASLALSHLRKRNYQNGSIHRKLRVPTSVIFCHPEVQYLVRKRSALGGWSASNAGAASFHPSSRMLQWKICDRVCSKNASNPHRIIIHRPTSAPKPKCRVQNKIHDIEKTWSSFFFRRGCNGCTAALPP